MKSGLSTAQLAYYSMADADALQIRWQESRPHTLVLAGDLDLITYPSLACAFDDSGMQQPPRVELDFRDVRFIDLGAIRWLCSCQERMREQGGDLTIRDASPWVRKIFGLVVQGGLLAVR